MNNNCIKIVEPQMKYLEITESSTLSLDENLSIYDAHNNSKRFRSFRLRRATTDQRFDKKDIYNKEIVLFWILKFDTVKIAGNKFDAF